MFDYVPDVFRKQYAETEEEARPLVRRPGQQPASARAAAPRRGRPGHQLRGQGRPRLARTAACSSTSPRGCRPRRSASGCRRCTTSSRSWPTSTSPPSRWRSARPATTSWAASRSTPTPRPPRVPGLFAAGEVVRRHARLEPARRQLAVRPARVRPAGRCWARRTTSTRWARRDPSVADADVDDAPREAEAPFDRRRRREPLHDPRRPAADDERPGRHHPHRDEVRAGARRASRSSRRAPSGSRSRATGSSTPAGTSRSTCTNMLLVSECVARAALIREESRGGHTRDDFPEMSPEWRKVNLVCRTDGDGVEVDPAAAAGDAARAARRCSTATS